MQTIGLTGGIGSGKTTVAKILTELGAFVIDADQVGHELYLPAKEAWRKLLEAFGPNILLPDETIDRKKLGARVFVDPRARETLNRIVHPLILENIRERIRRKREEGFVEPVVLEAALLIEANWRSVVDQVWVVVAGKDHVVARIGSQRGLTPDEVELRLASQLSDDERCKYADIIIENNGSLEELREKIVVLWRKTTIAVPK